MKKTYLQPEVSVISTNIKSVILEGSLIKSEEQVSGGSGGWVKEDNAWDIWGEDVEEEEF